MASDNQMDYVVRALDEATEPLRGISEAFRSLQKDIGLSSQQFENFAKTSHERMAEATKGIIASALAAGAAFATMHESIEKSMDVTESIERLGVMTDRTKEQTEELGESFKALSSGLGIHIDKIVAAASVLPAGILKSTEQTKAALEESGEYVKAWGGDLADVTATIPSLFGNIGLSIEQLHPAFGMMGQMFKDARITAADFKGHMSDLSTAMDKLGVKGLPGMASVGGIVTALVKNGMGSDEAFTGLNQMLNKAGTDEALKKFMPMGNLREIMNGAAPDQKGLVLAQQIKRFYDAYANDPRYGAAEARNRTEDLFGPRAYAFALRMISAEKDIREETDKLRNSADVTGGAFRLMMGTWGEKFEALGVAMDNFSRTLGNALGETLAPYAEWFKGGVEWLDNFTDHHKELVTWIATSVTVFAGLNVALAAARFLFWWIVPAISLVAATFRGLAVTIAALDFLELLNPIGLAVLAIAAAAGVAYEGFQHWDQLKATFADVIKWIDDIGNSLTSKIVSALDTIIGKTKEWMQSLHGPKVLQDFLDANGASHREFQFGKKPGAQSQQGHSWLDNILGGIGLGNNVAVTNPLESIDHKMGLLLDQFNPTGMGGAGGEGGAGGSSGGGGASGGGGGDDGHIGPKLTSAQAIANRKESWDFWKKQGLSDAAAAALIGSEGGESNFNPHAAGDHGHSVGIFQWSADRRAAMSRGTGKNFAGSTHMDQLEMALWEMKHGDAGAQKAFRILSNPASTFEQNNAAWVHLSERSANQGNDIRIRGGIGRRAIQDLGGNRAGTGPLTPTTGAAHPAHTSDASGGLGALQTHLASLSGSVAIDHSSLDATIKKMEHALKLKQQLAQDETRGKRGMDQPARHMASLFSQNGVA